MEMINVKINNIPVTVPVGTSILEAARQIGIKIPTLCYLKEINEIGACRICVAEVKGARSLVASCVFPLEREGTEVFTNSKKVRDSRKTTLELILSNHERKCLSCHRSGHCELQEMCHDFEIEDASRFDGSNPDFKVDTSTLHLVRDNNKCILCRRCVAVCKEQYVSVIGANNRGFDTQIGCAFDKNLHDAPCVSCGQCTAVCPTAALIERDQTEEVFEALADPEKIVIVHTAPSVRATLGECFDMPIGSNVKGKMVRSLKMLGFDKVFDTDFGADLTIMEEATEFLHRVQEGGTLPLITSCSPGWIKFCEHYYPEFIPNLSSCKSPQQMTGAIIKSYYAELAGIDPKKICVVAVMPCTAKKFEAQRDDQAGAGLPDNDIVLTTRELARMIKSVKLDFTSLEDDEFDPILGQTTTGAAAIFGATGGVMEAALRTAADVLTGEDVQEIEYHDVRGTKHTKEATYNVAGMEIKVAAVSGLKHVAALLDKVKSGEANYHFIEVMCCPGGCVNGGGQPIQSGDTRNFNDLKALRAKALYDEDANLPLRKSHDNPDIKKLYDEYLEKPGSHLAHRLLHTTYAKRDKYTV